MIVRYAVHHNEMLTLPDGDWVRYADHLADRRVLAEWGADQERQITALTNELKWQQYTRLTNVIGPDSPDADFIRSCFRSPEDAPPTHLAMMRAYLDESGHETKDWVFVAGFVGTENQWLDCAQKWRPALGQRPFLHMTNLRWKQDRTRRLLARLGPIPHQCGLEIAFGGVRVSDYADLIPGSDERIYKGYQAALMPLVTQVLRGIPRDERIEFVFEEQREYRSAVEWIMAFSSINDEPYKTMADGKPKIAKWGFVPKGSTNMTDPADYVAYALHEHYSHPGSEKAAWTVPILASENGKPYEGYGLVQDREQARRIVIRAQQMASTY